MALLNTLQWRWLGGVAVLAAALGVIDQTVPQAGLWALLAVSLSSGLAHGALDAQLLWQRAGGLKVAIVWALAYLLAVLGLGWLLVSVPSAALAALLLMSAWHFGEPYGRWNGLHPGGQMLTRAVVGGAPVMLPVWLSPQGMTDLQLPMNAMTVWRWLAMAWLLLAALWLLAVGLRSGRAARYVWAEFLGAALPNLLLSPLMAFAVYFGIYHAPVHIWRVWRIRPRDDKTLAWGLAAVTLISVFTVVLGAVLWRYTGLLVSVSPLAPVLNWLIIGLAALTLPHLVLISLCSSLLTRSKC